jgi:hypothetical protein
MLEFLASKRFTQFLEILACRCSSRFRAGFKAISEKSSLASSYGTPAVNHAYDAYEMAVYGMDTL